MWVWLVASAVLLGLTFIAARIEPLQRPKCVPPLFARASLFALLLEAPYAWLLWIDYPLTEYRAFWMRLWPALPGFPVGVALRYFGLSRGESLEILAMSFATAAIFVGLVALSRISRWAWWGSIVLAMLYGALMSLATLAAYRM